MMGNERDIDLGSDATIRGFREGQRVFGRYTLQRVLGRGGMGVVWLARDEELERLTAIKFLPELIIMDPEALRDLKRETRRNLDITHANIVRIYDFAQDATGAGITMEYVEGETLGALKAKSPNGCLDAETLAPWLVQICDALHYAHTKPKVAHRDLKPANIMLQKDGEIKVTDFGIASSISDTVSRVSMRAGSSGTPVFMSPQQAVGQRPTARDDIYSLGATIYDLLTGKPPFYTGQLMHQLEHVVPPLMRDRRMELEKSGMPIPEAWEEVVAACLAKNPAERPASVKEVGERLAWGLSSEVAEQQMVEDSVAVLDSGAGTGGDWVPEPEQEAVTPEVLQEAMGLGGEQAQPCDEDVHSRGIPPRHTSPTNVSTSAVPAPSTGEGGAKGWMSRGNLAVVGVVVAVAALMLLGMVMNAQEQEKARKQQELAQQAEAARVAAEAAAKEAELARLRTEAERVKAAEEARVAAEAAAKAEEARKAAAGVSMDKGYENGLGMKFVPVGGLGMLFSVWETRVRDYRAFCEGTGQERTEGTWTLGKDGWKERGESWKSPGFEQGENHPVVGASWEDAVAFCAWLTEKERKEGRIGVGQKYRLPSDAEWSAAVGGGKYPWGDEWPPPRGAGNYAGEEAKDSRWPDKWGVIAGWRDGFGRTSPVGSFEANRYGLYDMGGNAWEWCQEWYKKEMNSEETLKAVPVLNEDKGGSTYKVVRGGSWGTVGPDIVASSYRDYARPGSRGGYLGFRCVLVGRGSSP